MTLPSSRVAVMSEVTEVLTTSVAAIGHPAILRAMPRLRKMSPSETRVQRSRREQAEWAARNGPVMVRRIGQPPEAAQPLNDENTPAEGVGSSSDPHQ